ncbi:hypothetical protein D3C87_1911340 [compost metagenome]
MYFQLYLVPFIGMDSAVGIWMKIDLSLPPYSRTRTFVAGSSERRLASTQPADPAPMMM